jgi:hypothetical protein
MIIRLLPSAKAKSSVEVVKCAETRQQGKFIGRAEQTLANNLPTERGGVSVA